MKILRNDILQVIKKHHNRMTMFGNGDKESQEKFGRLIERLQSATDDPENWTVTLYVYPKNEVDLI